MRKERSIYLLILIVLGILAVTFLRKDDNIQNIEGKRYWINKTFSKKRYPVLFAGDSRVYRGISPGAFEEVYPGIQAFNLGYSSNGFHPDYLNFLEERLDTNASRPIIVLGISPDNFSNPGLKSEHFHTERFERKKEEVILYMHFYEILKSFTPLDIMRVLGIKGINPFTDNYKSVLHLDGWCESYWEKPDSTYIVSRIREAIENSMIQPQSVEILLNRVRKWTDEGISVFAYRSPSTYTIRMVEDSLSGFDFEPFINEITTNGAHWIDVDPGRYESYDGNHLERESARRLSRDLALEIRKIIN